MNIKNADLHIDAEQWNGLPSQEKAQKIKAISELVTPKVHPTQKPIGVIENLIRIFTDANDVVIDPVAGSGVTLLAAKNLGRRAYGFEIKKEFFKNAKERVLSESNPYLL